MKIILIAAATVAFMVFLGTGFSKWLDSWLGDENIINFENRKRK